MGKSDILKKYSALSLMFAVSLSAWSQTSITDEAGLKAIANDLGGSYVLANDISLSGEWLPVGTEEEPFTVICFHSSTSILCTSSTCSPRGSSSKTTSDSLGPKCDVKANSRGGSNCVILPAPLTPPAIFSYFGGGVFSCDKSA